MANTCGQCDQQFEGEEQYLSHTCDKTGYTPQDLEHHGARGIEVAKAALKRTNSLSKTAEEELDARKDELEFKAKKEEK